MSLALQIMDLTKTHLNNLFHAVKSNRISDSFFQSELPRIVRLCLQEFDSSERIVRMLEIVHYLQISAVQLSASNQMFVKKFIQNIEKNELTLSKSPSVQNEPEWNEFMQALDATPLDDATIAVMNEKNIDEFDVLSVKAAFTVYFEQRNMTSLVSILDEICIKYQNRDVFLDVCRQAIKDFTVGQKNWAMEIIHRMFSTMKQAEDKILLRQFVSN